VFDRPRWWTEAACRGVGTELFFGPAGQGTEQVPARRQREAKAKQYCASCPVAVDCLADALKFGDDGIRGGMSRYERYQTVRPRPPKRKWVVIATSTLTGKASLERHVDDGATEFRVVKAGAVVVQTADEAEAWIALHQADL
jgi:WhiB family redox-sensing transcriptional regulator